MFGISKITDLSAKYDCIVRYTFNTFSNTYTVMLQKKGFHSWIMYTVFEDTVNDIYNAMVEELERL